MLRFASLAHLYRVRLRRRIVQEILALVGIAAGVALVFTALVANSSLIGSSERITAGVVGNARYQVANPGGRPFNAAFLDRVRQIDGVKIAAPILDARAIVIGSAGRAAVTLMGVDSQLARLDGSLLRRFKGVKVEALTSVILPLPLARSIGATFAAKVTIQTGRKTTGAVPALPLPEDTIGGLLGTPMMIAPLAYAQRLSGLSGRITRILVQPAPGRDQAVRTELEEMAGGLSVRPADAEIKVFRQAAIPINQSTALFSLFAMLVGFLFALSAVLLTVPQRQRFVSDLRMAGHPPAVVIQVMLLDALVLGAAGSLVGLAVGDLLSRGVLGAVPGYLSFAFPVGTERLVTWSSIALAAASGLLAACVAVLAPLRDIFARRPPQPVRTEHHSRASVPVVLGLLCLVGSVAVTLVEPVAAVAGLVLLTGALLLLLPTLVRSAILMVARIGHHVRSPVPALAVMELRSGRTRARSFALAATAAVGVFASVSISSAQQNLTGGLDAAAHQFDHNADVWVTFPGVPNMFATTAIRIDNRTVDRIAQLPGVRSVRPYRGGFLDIGDRRVWVLAPPSQAPMPLPTQQIMAGDALEAAAQFRRGGSVVLSQGVADALRVRVGDRIRFPSPNPLALRVVALTTNLGWPPGTAIINADDYARGWGSSETTAALIDVEPDQAAPALVPQVRELLDARAPLTVETKAKREQRQHVAARQGLARTSQISAIVLWAAILALATATGGVIWQRRDTLARLKVDGLTEFQLWKGLLLECAVLLGAGCIAGAVFALGGQAMLTRGLVAITDFPVVVTTSLPLAVERVAIVLTVALTMLAVPGLVAVRVKPTVGHST